MILFKILFPIVTILIGQSLGIQGSDEGELSNLGKPVMHTFLATKGDVKIPDIIDKDEAVKIWTEVWLKAGFDPVILTTADAMLHPHYKEITHKLSKAGIDENRWGRYLRFAAMSARSGGWYSNVSILPLGFHDKAIDEMPNEGKFVIHQGDGGADLMSGSKEEWEKMTEALITFPADNDNALLKSLLEKDPELFKVEDSTASSIHILKSTGVNLCKLVTSKKITGAKFQYRIAVRAGIPRRNYYYAVHNSLSAVSNKCNAEKAKRRAFTADEQPEASNKLNDKMSIAEENEKERITKKQPKTPNKYNDKSSNMKENPEGRAAKQQPEAPNKLNDKMPKDEVTAEERTTKEQPEVPKKLNGKIPNAEENTEGRTTEEELDDSTNSNEEKAKMRTTEEQPNDSKVLNEKMPETSNNKNEPDDSNVSNEGKPDASNSSQLASKNESERPIMNTFFEPVDDNHDHLLAQLVVWTKAWEDAGWETKVLTLQDAKRHAFFNRYKKSFDKTNQVDDYNRMGFYRWLAMSVSGGGWMSDYDTMPLYSNPSDSLTLPNDGQFTSYQRHVPSLLAGDNGEWERMARKMYDMIEKHGGKPYSDSLALNDIQRETKRVIFDDVEVITPGQLYKDELTKSITVRNPFSFGKTCQKLTKWRAIHFSYAGCDEVGFCKKEREVALDKWVQAWREECLKA